MSPLVSHETALQKLVVLCLLACSLSSHALLASSAEHPNIVFILADDMGYGDIHALNSSSKIATPHLDGLAADGMTFTDAHTPSSVCTPTRYGLLTGRYCWRSRLKRGVQNGYGPPLIETERPTFAGLLREKGYQTGIVGKWHLGLGFAKDEQGKIDFKKPISHGPNQLGFDYSYIIPASLDFPPYVYIRDGMYTEFPSLTQTAQRFPAFLRKGERSPDFVMEDCLDHLADRASEWILEKAKSDAPYVLYFPLTAPHKPVLPHPRFRGKSELGPYGDFVMQVDATVGKVLESIAKTGEADNTLVIYSSDNGSFMYRSKEGTDHVVDDSIQAFDPKHHTSNYVFRGTKADVWEGGHHVPFLVRWPAKVAAKSKSTTTICLTDFFATAAEIVGETATRESGPDSFSFLPELLQKKRARPRPPVIHHSAAGMFSIRQNDWKLVLGNGSGGRENPRGKPFQRPYHLFNLSEDITESDNVIKDKAKIAEELEKACLAIRDNGHSR